MTEESLIRENLQGIRKRIEAAQARSGRSGEVVLIGVSKKQPIGVIQAGVAAGVKDLGENYVQEFEKKRAVLSSVHWHLIGPLQSNKAKSVVGVVDLIHTLDRQSLAEVVNRLAIEKGVRQKVLIQVNIAGEDTKSGVDAKSASEFVDSLKGFAGLEVCGFMTMPPLAEDSEASRPFFAGLRRLRDQIESKLGVKLPYLSMGTSQDFEAAVEEGATHVRVGTLLFGERT